MLANFYVAATSDHLLSLSFYLHSAQLSLSLSLSHIEDFHILEPLLVVLLCTNMYFENVELWNFDLTAPSTASREDIFRRRVILWMQITRTANHFLSRDTSKMQGNPLFSFVSFVHFRLSVLGDHWQPNVIWLAIIGQVNSYHFHYMAQVFFLEVCPYSSTASFVSVVRVAGKKAKKDF